MSDQQPPHDPNQPGGPEYLGTETDPAPRGGKRRGLAVVAAAGAVVLVGAGAFGAWSFLASGPQPAEAIPAEALGYVSIDLDPSGAQKIEAIRTLRKFPEIEKNLDLEADDDLRRFVFEELQESDECTDVDYDDDIEPWLGERLAAAALPADGGEEPVPLVVVQVSDTDAAAAGLDALAACAEAEDGMGYAFSGDWALISETEEQAQAAADAASESSLADDASFQEWGEAAGDAGVVNLYVAASAAEAMVDSFDDLEDLAGSEGLAPELDGMMGNQREMMEKTLADFQGAAAALRFQDGRLELEFAAGGLDTAGFDEAGTVGDVVGSLPADTGAALAFSLPEGYLQEQLDLYSDLMGDMLPLEQVLAELETETGLAVPEDVETLLGDASAVSVSSELDFAELSAAEDPSSLPGGITVQGDAEEIETVLEKIRTALGPQGDLMVSDAQGDKVAVGFSQEYVDTLLAGGSLGDEAAFTDVVPEADKSGGLLYLSFNGAWRDSLVQMVGGPPEVEANLDPLGALGISSWVDGDTTHGLLAISTD